MQTATPSLEKELCRAIVKIHGDPPEYSTTILYAEGTPHTDVLIVLRLRREERRYLRWYHLSPHRLALMR